MMNCEYDSNNKKRLIHINNPNELHIFWNNFKNEEYTLPVVSFYGHFSGTYACFSNFFRSPFDFELPKCCCEKRTIIRVEFGEQAIMACKAALMKDWESYAKICSSNKDPKTCKSLGRKVKPFNQKLWSNSVLEIAIAVVTQKFASNKFLWDILNKTENRVIAEMTQRDKNWGTGINKSHVNANNPPHWKGTNILGYALMIARKRLREDI